MAARVLICVPTLEKGGGIASYFRALRSHFASDVEFFTRGSRAGRRGLRAPARLISDYARFLANIGAVEIVHVNTSLARNGVLRDAVFVLLAKLRGRKVLVFFRGWDEAFERRLDRGPARAALRALFRADRILVLSARFGERLRHWGYAGEIDTESTAVDQRLIEAAASDEEPRPGSPSRAPRILFLARLERDKGVYIALETLAALLPRYPDAHLIVAGDGSEGERLRQYVAERALPNVEFLGHVVGDAKIEAFRRADLYLFPTMHGEGMPNSVLEAMAFGLPIVTRPVGGLADFFRDGEMGLLTQDSAAASFARLIAKLIESPEACARIAATNRRYAAEYFAAPTVAARLDAVYRELSAR